jgi:hypothetical protein
MFSSFKKYFWAYILFPKIQEILSFEEIPMSQRQWLTPVILATQEAEIRRIMVRSQPRHIV